MPNRFPSIVVAGFLFVVVVFCQGETNVANADACATYMPQSCKDASASGIELVNSFQHSGGMTGNASQLYCIYLVGIEVNEYCARQYRAIGRHDCADLSEQQAEVYRGALPRVRAAIDAVSASGIRETCSWER